MGSLVTEIPFSEVVATMELFGSLGVGSEDLRRFRAASLVKQRGVADVIRSVGLAHKSTLEAKDEPPLDTTIHVDRYDRLVYPIWAREVMHPDLEAVGPTKYDFAKVKLWLHEGQKGGKRTTGNVIYEHLKETDSLKNCLGLHDALEIQKKGLEIFRKLFGGKAVFCWKSVVRHDAGLLFVPCVYEHGAGVVVGWYCLDGVWDVSRRAARFAS